MPKRNSQYILSSQENATKEQLAAYLKLKLLNSDKLKGFDKNLEFITSENNKTPTDLAVKKYIKNATRNIFKDKIYLGEIENYYGVYSGYHNKGINIFVGCDGISLSPKIKVSSNYPLVVRIDNKEYSFTSISNIQRINNVSGSAPLSVLLEPNDKFGREESKYMTELKYVNINKISGKQYYIIKIGNEYSTVRVDEVNQKLIFGQSGSSDRGQWTLPNGNISDISIIPELEVGNPNSLKFELLDIKYLFIDNKSNVFYSDFEPMMITDVNELNGNEFVYGYNVYTEQWYKRASKIYTMPSTNLWEYKDKIYQYAGNSDGTYITNHFYQCVAYDESRNDYRWVETTQTISKELIQFIGMVGVHYEVNEQGISNTQTLNCSYSCPRYILKSQKNTISLIKSGDRTITSESGNNIITMLSDVIETKNYYYKWDFTNYNYQCQTVYLYIDNNGQTGFSLNIPYRNEYGGYYLNNRVWRCVGSVFFDNNKNMSDPWDLNGHYYESETYPVGTFAKLPVGFTGIVEVTSGGITTEYKSNELNGGITVLRDTVVKYVRKENV